MGLRTLDVGGNKLTGNIPAWIGTHLTSLTDLSLRFNEFDGIMPSTICLLTNIHVLDLSRNNISGRILRCLNNFTALVQKNSSIENAGEGNSFEEDDGFITLDFYICIAFGFITGFWIVVTTLILEHSWRHSYFNWWNNVGN
ncbi:unnamed protein product [Fraxinus pennsylvanica]|uniref:Uncharacterized protein n=1 Tax=Fraxinus pennsylvanica TaxID=56036 RepID=A0AAD2A1X0_9LAMI|nr:unnamed protein product [Fraxinus pennsylvanica]